MKFIKALLKTNMLLASLAMLFACNNSKPITPSDDTPSIEVPSDAVLIESMSFSATKYSVGYKKSITIRPNILPVNHTIKQYRWKSSNPEVISVNNTGYVQGLDVGEAMISCCALDGSGQFASVSVSCLATEVSSIKLDVTSKESYVNDEFTLKPTFYPADSSFRDVNYSSSDEKIAVVDESGKVTCLDEGKVTIRCSLKTNEKVFAECEVKVTRISIRAFRLSSNTLYLHVGETKTLTGKFQPLGTSDKGISFETSDKSIATVNQNGLITAKKVGKVTIKATTHEKSLVDTCVVEIREKGKLLKTSLSYNYKDYMTNNLLGLDCSPAVGDVKGLVIPVWFSDSNNYIKEEKRENVRSDLEKAFFGESHETGWESVKSYYATESHGRFAYDGMVTDWFECGLPMTRFKSESNQVNTTQLVSIANEWVRKTYPDVDFSEYDSDGNGYFDSFILVYGAPDYTALNEWSATNLWAYCGWAQNRPNYEFPNVSQFMFASYDFMYSEGNYAQKRTGTYYGSGNTEHMTIDAHTYIHEFGHILGLSDLYDYSQHYNPAGGFHMQDNDMGGHDPYSLLAIGWVDPYIPMNDVSIDIASFQESGDLILLTDSFNNDNSPFDEYILVEFYTPTGTYEFDANPMYNAYHMNLMDKGIRIWHIDARLVAGTSSRTISTDYKITTNPLTPDGKVYHMMTNSYSGEGRISVLGQSYAEYNLVQYIRNNKDADYKPRGYISGDNMFKTGDKFSINLFKNQFKQTGLFNSGDDFNWSLTVGEIYEDYATINLQRL